MSKNILKSFSWISVHMIFFYRLNQNFIRWSSMTSSPEIFIKKSINFLRVVHFPKCSPNLVLGDRLVFPTYCISQPFSLHVRTYITSFEFQSKSESLTTENCLLLTFEIIVLLQLRYLQQTQLLALHLEMDGYVKTFMRMNFFAIRNHDKRGIMLITRFWHYKVLFNDNSKISIFHLKGDNLNFSIQA